MSSAIATIQRSSCSHPSVAEATSSSVTPIVVPTARPITDRRSSGSERLASRKRAMCATRTIPYARAKASASSPNAPGTESAATSSAAMAAKITIRTAPASGSTTLVSQA